MVESGFPIVEMNTSGSKATLFRSVEKEIKHILDLDICLST